jgi:hypothetical protein
MDRCRPGRGTATLQEWNAFKVRNPQARLVCIDIQPYATTQALERSDILNVGGFSDRSSRSSANSGRTADARTLGWPDQGRGPGPERQQG